MPLRAGERSLAVHVEDHPLDYADFEGEIPRGEYGGGSVEVWDRGTYELERERPDGTLTVILHGEKLQGEWALVPAHLGGEKRNWLIVRAAKDRAAGPVQAYEPMLAREAQRVPSGKDWAFELAWEECAPWRRSRARGHTSSTTAAMRSMHARSASRTHAARCGRASASWTASSAHSTTRVSRAGRCSSAGVIVAYLAFDVLEFETEPLLDEPWKARRERLEALLDDRVAEVRLSRAYEDGSALRSAARARALGIVAKRRTAPYRPATVSDDWRLLRP